MSFIPLKKAHSASEALTDLPLKVSNIQSLNLDFNHSFNRIEMDLDLGLKKTKSNYGDRFIPSSINSRAYNMIENKQQKQQVPLTKKTSTQFYQEFLCEHILCKQDKQQAKYNKIMSFTKDISNKENLNNILKEKNLKKPHTKLRKIQKHSYKILDATSLQDDFYLNLLDWSSNNIIAAGLDTAVYLWSGCSSKICQLYEIQDPSDYVCSVSFSTSNPNHLSIGNTLGQIKVFDIVRNAQVCMFSGHEGRVGSLNWNSNGPIFASGARDGTVAIWDTRKSSVVEKYQAHGQQICGLKWSNDGSYIASGGNDNKLVIYSNKTSKQLVKFHQHKAAVKAIGWSPQSSGMIASGGGTADRHIRFFSTQSLTQISNIDTGSQVCNLSFSKISNEMVSTHGYSLNQINVWSIKPGCENPEPSKLATLTGHTYRVLYLANSPDGGSILTGAGDETLRFWNVFDKESIDKSQALSFNVDLR